MRHAQADRIKKLSEQDYFMKQNFTFFPNLRGSEGNNRWQKNFEKRNGIWLGMPVWDRLYHSKQLLPEALQTSFKGAADQFPEGLEVEFTRQLTG